MDYFTNDKIQQWTDRFIIPAEQREQQTTAKMARLQSTFTAAFDSIVDDIAKRKSNVIAHDVSVALRWLWRNINGAQVEWRNFHDFLLHILGGTPPLTLQMNILPRSKSKCAIDDRDYAGGDLRYIVWAIAVKNAYHDIKMPVVIHRRWYELLRVLHVLHFFFLRCKLKIEAAATTYDVRTAMKYVCTQGDATLAQELILYDFWQVRAKVSTRGATSNST